MRNVRDQASAEQQRLSAAWDQERQRVAEAQQSLQRQLSASQDKAAALSTDLATMEQRAATAEQRAAALESALQQANSATASMTGQMAQSMADASKQVRTLGDAGYILDNARLSQSGRVTSALVTVICLTFRVAVLHCDMNIFINRWRS